MVGSSKIGVWIGGETRGLCVAPHLSRGADCLEGTPSRCSPPVGTKWIGALRQTGLVDTLRQDRVDLRLADPDILEEVLGQRKQDPTLGANRMTPSDPVDGRSDDMREHGSSGIG